MDHDHLFSFALTERYKFFGCIYIAGWDVSLEIDSDTTQRAKMKEQVHSDQNRLSEITWLWAGITLAELCNTPHEERDTALDCNERYQVVDAILNKDFFSVFTQIKLLSLTEAIQLAQNVKRKIYRSGSQARRDKISWKDPKTI